MLQTEYLRSLHSNYERILLNQKPEEKKYQYCILMRGEVKGLLACNLRYINGAAYLYYDISGKQNLDRLFAKKKIKREWMRDFLWELKHLGMEMNEFLLDEKSIFWDPEHIFQDPDDNGLYFLYIPYYEYEGEGRFDHLLDFWIEHIDYEDEGLVEFVYKAYEEYEQHGDLYLQERIFTDAKCLEEPEADGKVEAETSVLNTEERRMLQEVEQVDDQGRWKVQEEKRGFLRRYMEKRKDRVNNGDYKRTLELTMESDEGYVVAESSLYEDMPQEPVEVETEGTDCVAFDTPHRILTKEGKLLGNVDQDQLIIGRHSDEADLVLEDASVSRMHAGIIRENGISYLEDLNSQNGTFHNGVRMQPYERRRLDEGDEIHCGKVEFIYR